MKNSDFELFELVPTLLEARARKSSTSGCTINLNETESVKACFEERRKIQKTQNIDYRTVNH